MLATLNAMTPSRRIPVLHGILATVPSPLSIARSYRRPEDIGRRIRRPERVSAIAISSSLSSPRVVVSFGKWRTPPTTYRSVLALAPRLVASYYLVVDSSDASAHGRRGGHGAEAQSRARATVAARGNTSRGEDRLELDGHTR